MKKKTIVILLIILLIFVALSYLGIHYIYYGSFTRSCIYTEEMLPVPEQLAKSKLVFAKSATVEVGHDKEYECLQKFGNIANNITNPAFGTSSDSKYRTSRGLTVETLEKGSVFYIIDVMAITKHGIATIDSGPGPLYYFLLKDKNGIVYKIQTAAFGFRKEDLMVSIKDSSETDEPSLSKMLNIESFNQESLFSYTGKLVDLEKSSL